jgi:hypothetical protein
MAGISTKFLCCTEEECRFTRAQLGLDFGERRTAHVFMTKAKRSPLRRMLLLRHAADRRVGVTKKSVFKRWQCHG